MYLLAIWLGKLIILTTRLVGNAGSALPGLVIEKFYRNFISRAGKKLQQVVLVTGTNGKTTTNKLLSEIVKGVGRPVITNRAGGNLSRGIASALLDHADWWGRLDARIGCFEVDEAFLSAVSAKLKPQLILVLNLLRDQLDRYGELDRTAELINQGLKYARKIILNADDPLVAALGKGKASSRLIYFGAAAPLKTKLPHDAELLGTNPSYLQPVKGPRPQWLLTKSISTRSGQVAALKTASEVHDFKLRLPGVYNAYNGLAALAAAQTIGLELAAAIDQISEVAPAFGRSEQIKIGTKTVQLLLVKNPAGFNQIINEFLAGSEHPILMAINDNFADGRDVSWLWDVDFEALTGRKHPVTATGIRGYDLAVRLKYAEIPSVTKRNLSRTLRRFVSDLKPGQIGYIVPTYTAMLSLRRLLKKSGDVGEVWR